MKQSKKQTLFIRFYPSFVVLNLIVISGAFYLTTVFSWYTFFVAVGATAVIAAGVYFLLQREVIAPLKKIKKGAQSFANEDFDSGIPLLRTAEFGELATLLNLMGKTIYRHEQSRKEFVANVSHELKTPITSIKGYLEILRSGSVDKKEDEERFLSIVSEQTERLIAIIDDLLALSYLERSEPEEMEFEEIAFSNLIERVIHYHTSDIAKKKMNIHFDCDESITIEGSTLLLEQMIGNLLTNAIKYSTEERDIFISALKKGDDTVFAIKDAGNGIASQHLDRIFERFYRVDKARSRDAGGTGLGLAIVKHIAQLHGATVSVESRIGAGSLFTVIFSSPSS